MDSYQKQYKAKYRADPNNKRRELQYWRDRYRLVKDRNILLMREYKESHPCTRCGFSDIRALEFHHRDRSTKHKEVAYMMAQRYSWESIAVEIGKCDVLCANCHAIVEDEIRQS